ncbi:helix-turn-helix transcriptional regulator [Salinarimonas soli]|uniref:Helix-turn-helix domain-containing protein n=1 Tax=Salinarimonas soli TaxID=1638099 RepID=A0A5B2VFK4_9HYPH|nr:helix-turn-helix domain-containing protein [Salinarimonas soli]KAA2237079.1 helix-turn-helix domain-containing protein [Salinarimonas soli]
MTSDRLLLTTELARRWRLSPRTLEGWRRKGIGPRFVCIGRGVRYRLDDVAAFENMPSQDEDALHRGRP